MLPFLCAIAFAFADLLNGQYNGSPLVPPYSSGYVSIHNRSQTPEEEAFLSFLFIAESPLLRMVFVYSRYSINIF